jgi:REP element-mobilizing transposase RayT
MPVARRHFAPGQLQFITSSVYRRLKLFDSQRLRFMFVELLREYRQEKGFLLIGWVLMPEHFHFLIRPQAAENTSALLQELKERTRNGLHLVCKPPACLVPQNACRAAPAAQRSLRCLFPCLAAALLPLGCLQREETPGEAQLYAQQSGEERLGALAGGIALVELQVLLSQ